MTTHQKTLTLYLDGTRYRGAYRIAGRELIVEAYGLGERRIDASIVDYDLGDPAHKLAMLTFTQLIKENLNRDDDTLRLVIQGSTTQPTIIGPPS